MSNPTTYLTIDHSTWDERAKSLGGTSGSLMCGFVAKLAQQLGWASPVSGTVRLGMPVSERSESDFRANALSGIEILLDPAQAAESLGEIRAKIKISLAEFKDKPHPLVRRIPLLLAFPNAALRKILESPPNQSPPLVTNSSLGELDPSIMEPDGTMANNFFMRLATPGAPGLDLAFKHDHLYVVSGHANGKLFLCVNAYSPSKKNSQLDIKTAIATVLAQFGLDGTIL